MRARHVTLIAALVGCAHTRPVPTSTSWEAVSPRGRTFEPLRPTGEVLEHYEHELAGARERWERGGTEEDAIWVGRHLGYLGRYRQAVAWYTARLEDFPASYRLRRHRGHRLISLYRFEEAARDLGEAWELARGVEDAIEPDGAPNELGMPRSTDKTNITYHLALAHFLLGDLEAAEEHWRTCAELSPNDDMLVAALNWQVHALRLLGREEESRAVLGSVGPDMDVIENHAYHRLLLLQRGELGPEELLGPEGDGVQNATVAFGVSLWALANGDEPRARALWEEIASGTPWNAFGHIGAEAMLARAQ